MRKVTLLLGLVFVLVLAGCDGQGESTGGEQNENTGGEVQKQEETVTADIPEVTVRMGLAPYADHTDTSIAIEKGWFEDVGITLEWSVADPDQFIGILSAGSMDILTGCETNFIPVLDKLETRAFVLNDAFMGYAILAQPDSDAKSYDDFIAEGNTPEEAVQNVMAQLVGKNFAYPSESGIRGFINLCFSKGGVDLDDVESYVQEDSNSIVLMLNKTADFQTGGVPSRVTLEGQGFKPILTSMDLIETVEASPDSEELRSVVHGSWNCTKEYADENHDTLLRMASVKFRINEYIKDNPDDAAGIHAAFLNKIAGTDFTNDEILVSYNSLSPFYTFDEQNSWFYNEEDPLYWSYISDSLIKMYEEEGVLKEGVYQADDFMMAQDIYAELLELKETAAKNLEQLSDAQGNTLTLREEAQKQYDIFNYLDAARISEAALSAQ